MRLRHSKLVETSTFQLKYPCAYCGQPVVQGQDRYVFPGRLDSIHAYICYELFLFDSLERNRTWKMILQNQLVRKLKGILDSKIEQEDFNYTYKEDKDEFFNSSK
jgi:hypothetical protein